jgi:uncharacterized membrane protein YdjX (TVP38/TMEM64 family)
LAGLVIIGVLLALWRPVSQIGADLATVRGWIERAGVFGPAAFFLLNMIQIVVAPIPGYPVQVLGGILFGFIPGVIYTVGGMVAGGVLAAWLGRYLGRPWLEKRLGTATLQQWSRVAHFDSFWTWWLILLIPLGDIPYFLAGLSRIRLSRFALAILASRGPFTALLVWSGERAAGFSLSWLALLAAAIGLIVIAGFSLRPRIEAWARAYLARQPAQPDHSADRPVNGQ